MMMLDLRRETGLAPLAPAFRPWMAIRRLKGVIALWKRRHRENQELLALDERELRDIRLSRSDALALARRPLWR